MEDTVHSRSLNFFYCYDKGLATWLKHMRGIEYNCTGYHIRTKDQFWQFTHTNELSVALVEYKGMLHHGRSMKNEVS